MGKRGIRFFFEHYYIGSLDETLLYYYHATPEVQGYPGVAW